LPNAGGGKADPLASGGWEFCPQIPISVNVLCIFFSLHLPHKALYSFGINPKELIIFL